VRAARVREALAVEQARITEETAFAIGRQVESGEAPPLEGIRAEVAHESAEAELAAARASLRDARIALGAFLDDRGIPADVSGGLRGDPVTLDPAALPAELERNPGLLALAWEAETARRGETEASRARWPGLEAEVGVRRYVAEDRTALVTGLGVEIPLWDHRSGALRAARETAVAAGLRLDAERRRLNAELQRRVTAMESARRRLVLYRDSVLPQAEDALEIARAGFRGGKFTYLELLDAQQALLAARGEEAETRIAYDEALHRLESLLDRDPRGGFAPEAP
jgi:cobalt-zinc-cadmium efflux system outer membrane protein